MTYEQDKELRHLKYKHETITGLMEYADFSRRCELEVELQSVEAAMNRLYESLWQVAAVGGKNGNHR